MSFYIYLFVLLIWLLKDILTYETGLTLPFCSQAQQGMSERVIVVCWIGVKIAQAGNLYLYICFGIIKLKHDTDITIICEYCSSVDSGKYVQDENKISTIYIIYIHTLGRGMSELVSEWVSECFLTVTQQFCSYQSISWWEQINKWWWGPFCTWSTRVNGFL